MSIDMKEPTLARRKEIISYIQSKVAQYKNDANEALKNVSKHGQDQIFWLQKADQALRAVDILTDVLFFASDPTSRQPTPFEPGV